jgi:sulfite exporter TauE/SafE/copper chaperone CopZ/plastocyanin
MPTLELPVTGMTCRACETKVSRSLGKVPGVTQVRVSARRGVARVLVAEPVSRSALRAAVRRAGYDVGRQERPWLSRDRRVWRDVAAAVAVLAVIALIAQATGATDAVARLGGTTSSGGLVVALVLGLAAGLSTCMALVGGLVLGISARFARAHPDLSTAQKLRPHVAFNAGRVAGFAALGAAMGGLGAAITLDTRMVAVLMIVVSLVMGAVGLQLAAVSPRLSAGTIALPAGLGRALRLDRGGYSHRTAFLAGAGSFFLPCGFTQAVQIYALSTGSPGEAAAIMGLFALGTTPGLLGIGGLTAAVRGEASQVFFRFAGVTVIAFAALNVHGALGVLAPGLRAPDGGGVSLSQNVSLDGDIQVLRTTQVANGYEPAAATIYVGREVRWEVDSTALSCAAALYAPALGIDAALQAGLNVFTFTPESVGTIRYSCAMGMYWGSITVIEDPGEPA